MFGKACGQNAILDSAHDNISQLIKQMKRDFDNCKSDGILRERLKREVEYLQEDLDAISKGNVSVALKYW